MWALPAWLRRSRQGSETDWLFHILVATGYIAVSISTIAAPYYAPGKLSVMLQISVEGVSASASARDIVLAGKRVRSHRLL